MERIVIACYRPKPGRAAELDEIVRGHVPLLRSHNLVTPREAIVMKAADGTVIEVFEWRSQAAIDAAHSNPAVMALWDRFGQVCDYVPVGAVPEAGQVFSEFAPFESPPDPILKR